MKKFVLFILLILTFTVYFFPVLFENKVYFNTYSASQIRPFDKFYDEQKYRSNLTDPLCHWYSLRYYIAKYIKKGILPLWNTSIVCGHPIYADGWGGIFNPIFSLLKYLSVPKFMTFLSIFSLLISSIFTYLYCLLIGLQPVSAFFAGIGILLSPTFLQYIEYDTALFTFCGIPVGIYFIEKWTLTRKFYFFAFSILSSLFFSLGGQIHATIFCCATLVCYIFVRSWQENFKKAFVYSFMFLFFFLSGYSIQLLPILKFFKMSTKSIIESGSLSVSFPTHPVSWFFPSLFFIPHIEKIGYFLVGKNIEFHIPYYNGVLLTLIFVSSIFIRKKSKLYWFFLIVSWINLIFIDWLANPLCFIVSRLPFISFLKQIFDSKYQLFNVFNIVMVGSFFIDSLLKDRKSWYIFRRVVKIIAICVFVPIFILLCATTIIFHYKYSTIKQKAEKKLIHKRHFSQYKYAPTVLKEKIEHNLKIIKSTYSIGASKNILPYLVIFGVLLIFKVHNSKERIPLGVFCIVGLFIIENILGGKLYQVRLVNREDVFPSLDFISFLDRYDKSLYRVLIVQNNRNLVYSHTVKPLLLSNTFVPYNLQSPSGFESMHIKYYYKFVNKFMKTTKSKVYLEFEGFEKIFLNMLNVKYIITPSDNYLPILNSKDFRLIYDREVKIYYNTRVLPRAYIVNNIYSCKTLRECYSLMSREEFDPSKNAVVIGEKYRSNVYNRELFRPTKSKVEIKEYSANKIIINVNTPTDSFLFLSECFYPGWKAKIDNKPVRIELANGAFRLIPIEKGNHIVEFKFMPEELKYSFGLSCISIIILMSIVFFSFIRSFFA